MAISTQQYKEEALTLWGQGMSFRGIARHFGGAIAHTTIVYWVRQMEANLAKEADLEPATTSR